MRTCRFLLSFARFCLRMRCYKYEWGGVGGDALDRGKPSSRYFGTFVASFPFHMLYLFLFVLSLVAYCSLSFPFSVCAYSFLSLFLFNILSPSHECLHYFLHSFSFSLFISFVLCFFPSSFPYFVLCFLFLSFLLWFFRSFVVSFGLSSFFSSLSLFLSIYLSFCLSFFLSLKPNSLCFVLSLFLSFLHFPLSFCLCFFPCLYLSFVLCFILSFVRGAKNQEPLKARTCRKSARGEPNQGRAKPLQKKTWPPITLKPSNPKTPNL